MNFSDFFLIKYASDILERTLEHLLLVVISIGIATIVSIPLGILITRQKSLRQPILGIANILQTIPSQLAGRISADEMRQLNYLVEGELRDIKEVVSEFRKAKKL
jgi:ABC-type phosphate/phosphonate transport system permease subunit